MAASRPRAAAWTLAVVAVVAAGLGIARQAVTGNRARLNYRGHLLLVWAIDKPHGSVAGFSREPIRPGQVVELVPVRGHGIRFEAGPIDAVTVTDSRKEWKEDLLPLKVAHGRSSSEGTRALQEPFLSLDYGIDEPVGSVTLGVPVASLDSSRYREVLGRDDLGTASGLEDLLFAALEDPHSGGHVRISDVLDVYRMLGRSQRLARWTGRLLGETPAARMEAAAVLTVLGDEAGTTAFCRACLEARGNKQVRLINILCQMPPSDDALATIVKLIIAPSTYLMRSRGGGGVADTERRFLLVRALAEKYPKEAVRKYTNELRAYAGSLPVDSAVRENLRVLLESR